MIEVSVKFQEIDGHLSRVGRELIFIGNGAAILAHAFVATLKKKIEIGSANGLEGQSAKAL
jgi:hypothetical protein